MASDPINALEAQAQANAEIADAARKYVWAQENESPFTTEGYNAQLDAWYALAEAIRKHTTET